MPLLRKKQFIPLPLPPDLKADEEVFMNPITKEIFRDYEEFFKRSILCNSLLWSCEYTGKCNLTLSEALQSEVNAQEQLDKVPFALQQGILYIIHTSQISSLNSFVDDVLSFYRQRFLIGEVVDILPSNEKMVKQTGEVSDITVNTELSYRHPIDILYRVTITGTGDEVKVPGSRVYRHKNFLTRERVKLLVKCSARKASTEPPLYAVKEECVQKLELDDKFIKIPYLLDFTKAPTKSPRKFKGIKKKRPRENDAGEKPAKKPKKASKPVAVKKEPDVDPEEKKRLMEEERARKRKQRQDEREQQKKMALAEQQFQKIWMRTREDLELTDSKELPYPDSSYTFLPCHLVGDVLSVTEFFSLFGENVDFAEEFPNGVSFSELERSLLSNKLEGIFGELVIYLLKLLFALHDDEDDEETKYSIKSNTTSGSILPDLNTEVVDMKPNVSWTVEEAENPSLLHASQAYYFSSYYWSTHLSKIQVDTYTVTEVLRLYILGAGGRNNGQNYHGKWRHNYRGMYNDSDDPKIELRTKNPDLVTMLGVSNIYDLPASNKLLLLKTLINDVLSFSQFRDVVEEAFDISKEAKREWKSVGNEIHKKEKEESASRYKEWIASRIKLKEDKKKKALSDNSADADREETPPIGKGCDDISEAVNESESIMSLSETAKPEAIQTQIRELRTKEYLLYQWFRESSCKVRIRTLGEDRYFRKYWSFTATPGIFVEWGNVDISALFAETSPSSFLSGSRINGSDSDQLSQLANGSISNYPAAAAVEKVSAEPVETVDPSIMSVDKIVELKLMEAEKKYGRSAKTYNELVNKIGFSLLEKKQNPWTYFATSDEIDELLTSLNPRGIREKELIENLKKDKERIFDCLKTLPKIQKLDPKVNECRENETDEQKRAREVLENTSAEKLMEANVRETICDLENRIYEASFSCAKAKDRMVWRKQIEDFWLDDNERFSDKDTEDMPQIPITLSGESTLSEPVTNRKLSAISRRSIVSELSSALLNVEQGLPSKYLSFPLGETPVQGRKAVTILPKYKNIPSIERWRQSLSECSNLSQILIHLAVLDSSILWNRSLLKTSCRVCRRRTDPEKMLLCDECDCGTHIWCCRPKLKSIPSGSWFCAACKPKKTNSNSKKAKQYLSESDEDSGDADEVYSEDDNESSIQKPQTLQQKLKACQKILKSLQEDENGWPFLEPVDGELVPNYYEIIPNPMDLSTIQSKLKSNKYKKVELFIDDVELIFLNCKHYNTSKAPAYKAGVKLEKLFYSQLNLYGLDYQLR